jgi:hypothetical protein
MRQVDHIGCGAPDAEPVDLALELPREIIAAVGAGRRSGKADGHHKRGAYRQTRTSE